METTIEASLRKSLVLSHIFEGDYRILALVQCDYYSDGISNQNLIDFFSNISDQFFCNRDESVELQNIIHKLT